MSWLDKDVRKEFRGRGTMPLDFFRLMVGPAIGAGCSRVVYGCQLRDDLVLKIELGSYSFSNIKEWEMWQAVVSDDHKMARWLAPCEFISPCGTVLAQKRTTRPEPHEFPSKMPAFLTDTKQNNFGMYEDLFVCHDYGMSLLWTRSSPMRLRNATWWC